jgi:thiol-disulfide isomerase/thioredoxin
MDRLPTLIALLGLVACDKSDGQQAGEPAGRVNAAKVTVKKTDTAAFCDKQFPVETAPAFATPELAGGGALAASAGKWRWVNVWATWCKPCVEELPRLVTWQQTMPFELQIISVDESDEDVAAYRKLHPETPDGKRLAKPEAQAAWFAQLGLDGAAPIPVHIFVDAANKVRCVRAGGVREQDQAMVEALLAGK